MFLYHTSVPGVLVKLLFSVRFNGALSTITVPARFDGVGVGVIVAVGVFVGVIEGVGVIVGVVVEVGVGVIDGFNSKSRSHRGGGVGVRVGVGVGVGGIQRGTSQDVFARGGG